MTSSSRSCWLVLGAAALLSAPASVAHAQAAAAESISEQEFLSRIDGVLPELEMYEAAILDARAQVQDTRSLAPLDLEYEREEVFSGGEALALKNAVVVGWTLDISGSRGRRIASAEHALRATRAESAYGKQLAILAALKIYKRAARARLRVEALERARVALRAFATRLENRVREGDASGYELSRFQLEMSDHDQLLAEASTEQTVAEAKLAAVLGELGSQLGASDDLKLPAPPAAQDADSADEHGAARGDLLATQYLESSGKSLQQAASRWWIPSLDLSVGYLNTDLGLGTGPGADIAHGYTGTVSAAIPIFSRGSAERLRGAARIQEARARRKLLERKVHSEVQTARTLLQAHLQQARAFEQNQLVQIAELVERAEAAYQGGEVSALELHEAHARASAARLRYIEMRYQAALAEIALRSATGWVGKGRTEQ